MNPFKINKTIKKFKSEGKNISTNDLSRIFDCRISHAFLRLSNDVFVSETGRPHHKVTGLKAKAWFDLWFYNPPKFSEYHRDSSKLEIPQDIDEYRAQKAVNNESGE